MWAIKVIRHKDIKNYLTDTPEAIADYEVGHYAPDGTWVFLMRFKVGNSIEGTLSMAVSMVSKLNGGK